MYHHMPYTELQIAFRNEIQTVLYHYQRAFENKRMPAHRVADMAALYAALTSHDDALTLCDEIQRVLAAFKTGWFIFKTGRSRLRDALQPHLLDPCYSREAFLLAQNAELQQQLNSLAITIPEDEFSLNRDDGFDTLRKDLRTALLKLKELKAEIIFLKEENATLRDEIKSLQEKNHRLAGRNKTQRTMLYLDPLDINADSNDDKDSEKTANPAGFVGSLFSRFSKFKK